MTDLSWLEPTGLALALAGLVRICGALPFGEDCAAVERILTARARGMSATASSDPVPHDASGGVAPIPIRGSVVPAVPSEAACGVRRLNECVVPSSTPYQEI